MSIPDNVIFSKLEVLKVSQKETENVAGEVQLPIQETSAPGDSSSAHDRLTDVYPDRKGNFYADAKKYWSEIPGTVDGMLGGLSYVSHLDIASSTHFLKQLLKLKPGPAQNCALDCGAGIGRVTKHLLGKFFRQVDIVEQDEKFAHQAANFVGSDAKIGNVFTVGLQEFQPTEGKYDVIWIQWVLSHLTDEDLVQFFRKAAKALAKNGVIVLKENVTSSQTSEMDNIDSSATRPLKTYEKLIKTAKLRLLKIEKERNLPKGLYPVYMIALRPPPLSKTTIPT